jgi:hypothetical protein
MNIKVMNEMSKNTILDEVGRVIDAGEASPANARVIIAGPE